MAKISTKTLKTVHAGYEALGLGWVKGKEISDCCHEASKAVNKRDAETVAKIIMRSSGLDHAGNIGPVTKAVRRSLNTYNQVYPPSAYAFAA